MMYSPTAHWVPSEMWHTLWNDQEGRGGFGKQLQSWQEVHQLTPSTPFPDSPFLPHTLDAPPVSPMRKCRNEWLKLATFCHFFSLSNNRYTWRKQPSCLQSHNLRDAFQKALLFQQQCTLHRPGVSVAPEKHHPELGLQATAPSEGSGGAGCCNSWGCSTTLFKGSKLRPFTLQMRTRQINTSITGVLSSKHQPTGMGSVKTPNFWQPGLFAKPKWDSF